MRPIAGGLEIGAASLGVFGDRAALFLVQAALTGYHWFDKISRLIPAAFGIAETATWG